MFCIYYSIHYSQLNVLQLVVFVNLHFGQGQVGTTCLCSRRSGTCVGMARGAGASGTSLCMRSALCALSIMAARRSKSECSRRQKAEAAGLLRSRPGSWHSCASIVFYWPK